MELISRAFGTRRLLGIPSSTLRFHGDAKRARNFTSARIKRLEEKGRGRANGVDSLVARKPSRDDLIIGWRTSMVERERERGRSRWSSDVGGSGLYPGGKSPGRNQHDHGQRPLHARPRVYVQCYRNHFGITFGDRRDFDLRHLVPGH